MKRSGGWPGAATAELLAAIDEGRVPGGEWQYHVTAYRFPEPFTDTRDSIAMALRDSAWMAANIAQSGGPQGSALYALWERLRAAESVRRFDELLAEIRALAELDECWIEFVNPPDRDGVGSPGTNDLLSLPRNIGEAKASGTE